jgi:hypothetical protein
VNRYLIAILLLVVCSVPAFAQGVAATISGSTVTATGITPNGNAVFFGVMHGRRGLKPTRVHVDRMLADDNGDGIVTLTFPEAVPYRSVFAVVDFTTGHYTTVAPEGFEIYPTLDESPVVQIGTEFILSVPRPSLQMLFVRPNGGVWGQVLIDGSANDSDGLSDGTMTYSAAHSVPLQGTNSQAATAFQNGDVVFLIDSNWVTIYATRVGVTQ